MSSSGGVSPRFSLLLCAIAIFTLSLPNFAVRAVVLLMILAALIFSGLPRSLSIPLWSISIPLLSIVSLPSSVDASRTVAQLGFLCLITLVSCWVTSALSPAELSVAVLIGSGAHLVLGVVAEVVGISGLSYSMFNGLLANPNLMAFNIVVGIVASLGLLFIVRGRGSRTLLSVYVIASSYALWATGANGGYVYGTLTLVAFLGLLSYRVDRARGLLVYVVALVGALLVFGSYSLSAIDVLTGFGDNRSMSGRIPIWETAWVAIQDRPFNGWGLGSTTAGNAEFSHLEIDMLTNQLGLNTFLSHNGYLDIGVQLGVLGTVVAISLLVLMAIRSWRCFISRVEGGEFLVLITVMFTVYNITEVRLLDPPVALFLLFAAMMSAVSKVGGSRVSVATQAGRTAVSVRRRSDGRREY